MRNDTPMNNKLDKVTVIIPTKNRPDDLRKAVQSILLQEQIPDQLIIVDQSEDDISLNMVTHLLNNKSLELTYIHDSSISGLVDAKRVGVENSKHKIVCFLEDDIILDSSYIQEVLIGFKNNADMLACSGIITNQPWSSPIYIFFHDLFFRGIYFDPRIKIAMSKSSQAMVQCDVLSGGLSCWRLMVFDSVKFDVDNGFFMLEDIDFSTRAAKIYGSKLFVNKRAKLEHKWSPVNRELHGLRQEKKLLESIIFYKKRKAWNGALSSQLLVMIWWLMEAIYQSLRGCSFKPIKGYFLGIINGIQKELRS